MSEKNRCCPYCGGRTSQTRCEICQRKTVYTPRYDDMETQYHLPDPEIKDNFINDAEGTSSHQIDHSHIQQMMKDGWKTRSFATQSKHGRAFLIYAVIIIAVLILVGPLASYVKDEDHVLSSDSSLQTAYDYYEKFLRTEDRDPSKLICAVDADDSEIAVIHNPYSELFSADVNLELKNGKKETHSIWRGMFQSNEFVFSDEEITSCSLDHVEFEAFAYELPNFDYQMEGTRIDVDLKLSAKQVQSLSKHLYTKLIVAFYDINDVYDLYMNGEKSYEIAFDYYENRISFHELNDHEAIEDIDMTV